MSGIIESYQRKFDTNKIFLSSQQIVVYWAHITVIKAELICFEDLLEFPGGHPLTTWTKRGYRNVNESSHVGNILAPPIIGKNQVEISRLLCPQQQIAQPTGFRVIYSEDLYFINYTNV